MQARPVQGSRLTGKRLAVVVLLGFLVVWPLARLALSAPSSGWVLAALIAQPIVTAALVAMAFGLPGRSTFWALRARRAARRGDLQLWFQPKTALSGDGELVALEALSRWNADKNPLPPDKWIPSVERSFWATSFNLWVLNEALRQARAWADQERRIAVCVNVSPGCLGDPNFAHDVMALLARWELPGDALIVEVTERALTDSVVSDENVRQLAAGGVEVSLDDFGIGYSSLRRLVSLPLDAIKVDRSFIAEMDSNPRAAAVVLSAVELGHSLGLTVVAEGVESVEQWHRLRAIGVDSAQGYLIARPMPTRDVERWLVEHDARYVPERRAGEERRSDDLSKEEVLRVFGYDRRNGVERRKSERDALRERIVAQRLVD